MASLSCPNVAECGGVWTFDQVHEWDVGAHLIEVEDHTCTCDLTADQLDLLMDEASKLPMEEWQDD